MNRSLRLNATELNVLAALLGMRITPLSDSRTTRAEALESLVRRRIVDANAKRVSTQVATLLAVLARPRHRIEITPHSSTSFVIAVQTLTHVVHESTGDLDVITPVNDGISAMLSTIDSGIGVAFSLPGHTWHDMVAQARFANDGQLARMAQLDGCDNDGAATAAHLAKHYRLRHDARILTFRGNGRWRGSELSWIAAPGGAWILDDGGRFGTDSDLVRRRATFSPIRPSDALRIEIQTTN